MEDLDNFSVNLNLRKQVIGVMKIHVFLKLKNNLIVLEQQEQKRRDIDKVGDVSFFFCFYFYNFNKKICV